MCGIILPMSRKKVIKFNLITVFLSAFAIFAIILIPSLILTKGVWVYYGDFNVQQIPFYIHVHDAIKSGNFLYDWGTDLGGSLLGCYSFYNLGSPFFWITLLFNSKAVPYLMPWLTCLKYATMAAGAYAYMRRHLKTDFGAYAGALLFAFSGFMGAVLVYNHFHDIIAFFPIYLYAFENLFEKENEEKPKRVPFILLTALMIVINYYFFVGQVIFLIIYYFCTEKPSCRSLLRAFLCGLSGVCLAGVFVLPAVYYTLGNSRVTDILEGYDLVAYSDSTLLLCIIKNVVMLPDVSGLNSMLNMSGSRVSGVGGYLPLFSVAGVIAFFLYNKEKNFMKRIVVTCAVFAAVPLLNSLFSALNSEYYARWFYMPLLIMAMMTGSVLEDRAETLPYLKRGAITVGCITVIFALMSILPAKTDEGAWTVIGALTNYEQLISEIVFSVLMFFLLILYIRVFAPKKDSVTALCVICACILTAGTMFVTGTVLVDKERKPDFYSQAIIGESPLSDVQGFFRFETDQDFYNYPLMWDNSHCVTSFISTIPGTTFDVYHGLDMPRKVTSNPYTSRLGFRALCASRFFIANTLNSIERIGHIEDMAELKDYELVNEKNGFKIYENKNALPMGLVFDSFIYKDEYSDCGYSNLSKDRMLIKTLILDDNAKEYSDYVSHADISKFKAISLTAFEKDCENHRKTACSDFEATTNGFSAKAKLDKPAMVLFSVPYEDGFSAYVDGKETEIVKADFGFMAVCLEEGEHTIEFRYSLSYLKYGVYTSVFGLILFTGIAIYGIISKKKAENV